VYGKPQDAKGSIGNREKRPHSRAETAFVGQLDVLLYANTWREFLEERWDNESTQILRSDKHGNFFSVLLIRGKLPALLRGAKSGRCRKGRDQEITVCLKASGHSRAQSSFPESVFLSWARNRFCHKMRNLTGGCPTFSGPGTSYVLAGDWWTNSGLLGPVLRRKISSLHDHRRSRLQLRHATL